jgi:hypothetical protein
LRRDSTFEFVFREENAPVDQVSDRLVDIVATPNTRQLQMEERITGEWYRIADIITLVYTRSSFFKAKPSISSTTVAAVTPNDTIASVTVNSSNDTTTIGGISTVVSPLTSMRTVTSSASTSSQKGVPSSQSIRARRLHQGGTAADGTLELASLRAPKPPAATRASSSRRSTTGGISGNNNNDININTMTNSSKVKNDGSRSARDDVPPSTRIRLDRSGKPLIPRPPLTSPTFSDEKTPTTDNTVASVTSSSASASSLSSLSSISSKASHEIVEGGEWQYNVMDVYVFHELALGVNGRGQAALHNHAGPFRLIHTAPLHHHHSNNNNNSNSNGNGNIMGITISHADHGGVAALASALLAGGGSNTANATTATSAGGSNDGMESYRKVKFVNRRPLHDIPFVLTATDIMAALTSEP